MSTTLSVVILAAGRGLRMRSKLPKVLQTVGGIPMLTRIVSTAQQLSPQQILVVCRDEQQAAFQQAIPADITVKWAKQNEPLGTGHAVLQALPSVSSEQVVVLYGDISLITVETLTALLATADNDKNTLSLVSALVSNPHGLGRLIRDEQGKLLRIVEEKEASEEQKQINEINAGFFLAPKTFLEKALLSLTKATQGNEYYLPDVIPLARTSGLSIQTVQAKHEWEITGVNDKRQLAELERIFQREQANQLMAKGVTLLDPARIDIRGEVSVGTDVTIDVGVILEGKVVIEDDVQIGPNVYIKDSVLQAGTQVLANSVIDQATIGPRCCIGPFGRLRPGTVLAEEVKVGSFVEVKNSTLQSGAKAYHLSYIGDAEIGSNVNIGAGTITCNYDGKTKHKTTIKDNVFVGANTQLIAPVTVGENVIIGSGTIVTRDVPADHVIHNAITHRLVPKRVKEEQE